MADNSTEEGGHKARSMFSSNDKDAEDSESTMEAWSRFDVATNEKDSEVRSAIEGARVDECGVKPAFGPKDEGTDGSEYNGCDGWTPATM